MKAAREVIHGLRAAVIYTAALTPNAPRWVHWLADVVQRD